MNIKSLSNSLSAMDRSDKAENIQKRVKSENTSADRDPKGQREKEKDENDKQFLNDEEMEQALKTLKSFEGIKGSYLKVELVVNEVARHVLITDPQGKIVRRIPESELWPLVQAAERKGHLIDKTG